MPELAPLLATGMSWWSWCATSTARPPRSPAGWATICTETATQLQAPCWPAPPHQVLEHATGDFTVTVEAGMPQMSFKRCWPNKAVATHRSTTGWPQQHRRWWQGVGDPLRHKAMGLKDQVIISLLRSDGTTAQAGGQVVKNVAGYDLMRLLTGGWSNGLITQLAAHPTAARPPAVLCREGPACPTCNKACSIAPGPRAARWIIKPARSALVVAVEPQPGGFAATNSSGFVAKPTCGHWTGNPPPQLLKRAMAAADGVSPNALIFTWPGSHQALDIAAGCRERTRSGRGQAASHQVADLRQHCKTLRLPDGTPSTQGQEIQAWGNAPARPIIEAIKRQFDPLQQLNRGHLPS